MTTPSDDEPRTVRVPIRRGDSIFDPVEYAEVPEEVAAQWNAHVWHDRPPR
jgi:hypothetical protein